MKEYVLENECIRIKFLDIGATVTEILKKANKTNFVLCYQDYADYQDNSYYLGATIGRVAGRVFPPFYRSYGGQRVALDVNEGRLHLHGGKAGLHRKVWSVCKLNEEAYCLEYKDNDSIYEPIALKIVYSIEGNRFSIRYEGHAQEPTVCNITNHSYFNLNQDKTIGIQKHWLTVQDSYLQLINHEFVPTGELDDMGRENAHFDFSKSKQIVDALELGTELSRICAGGIDVAYVFDKGRAAEILLESETRENDLRITSDQESCVIYTLNKVSVPKRINQGASIYKYGGVTFEMQRSPNYLHQSQDILTQRYIASTHYEIL
ncbi:hypothetical protein [Streptococcus cuniculi]|uniref:Aldose 1-epimerase n=1 Tax=Streptococcus cuniculi TaxID=1432788 RepID=A0A4Y9J7H4_9STRE|nr:hypothetical protein [Streptococcus cuniculi]MBF0779243.1 hypothetical protein [Streptococcus cuniculi]TFU96792.1 hypothetical protein E4T82_11055 [Streptococcus cuniculi]